MGGFLPCGVGGDSHQGIGNKTPKTVGVAKLNSVTIQVQSRVRMCGKNMINWI